MRAARGRGRFHRDHCKPVSKNKSLNPPARSTETEEKTRVRDAKEIWARGVSVKLNFDEESVRDYEWLRTLRCSTVIGYRFWCFCRIEQLSDTIGENEEGYFFIRSRRSNELPLILYIHWPCFSTFCSLPVDATLAANLVIRVFTTLLWFLSVYSYRCSFVVAKMLSNVIYRGWALLGVFLFG